MHRPSTAMATVLTDAEHTLLVISLIGGFIDTVLVLAVSQYTHKTPILSHTNQ